MERRNDAYLQWLGALAGQPAGARSPRDADRLGSAPDQCTCSLLAGNASLAFAVEEFKRRLIRRALEQAGGSQTRAAELLGMHQSNLSRLMKTLELR